MLTTYIPVLHRLGSSASARRHVLTLIKVKKPPTLLDAQLQNILVAAVSHVAYAVKHTLTYRPTLERYTANDVRELNLEALT